MPEGNGSGWRDRAVISTARPPVLNQTAVQTHNQEMFKERATLQLLSVEGREPEELRRMALAAGRHSTGVTAAIIRGYTAMGEGSKVQEIKRQHEEVGLLQDTRQNHSTLHTQVTVTVLARQDDLHKEVTPLVQELKERAEKNPDDGKAQDAWNQVKRALAEDEQDRKDGAKLREQGRNEGLATLEERDTQIQELRFHLQQKDKQVEFLQSRVTELEAGVPGKRSAPR